MCLLNEQRQILDEATRACFLIYHQHLVPDSAEWFEWLATISSFRFVGQQGRFTAYRDTKHGSPTRSWRAYRTIHQHNYKCSLGVTDALTLACLEQAAATLQAHLPSL